ncbi:MAG: hypothetical protein M1824_000694 [Vezdaea acicularis]|nr:MAG: hypothetical protein M1824_000694 [Vezdaea acicularis]
METERIQTLLEQLDDEVDDLQESLGPLLQNALSKTAAKLPLLDKAKLYVLVTYAIESILFSFLRLNGVNAREQPVFTELTRVKQYFGKVKDIESQEVQKRTITLDKAAAGRIIKNGLAGNERHDQIRFLREAEQRANASQKLQQLPKKRKFEEPERQDVSERSSSSSEDLSPHSIPPEGTSGWPTLEQTSMEEDFTKIESGNSGEKGRKRKTKSEKSKVEEVRRSEASKPRDKKAQKMAKRLSMKDHDEKI